MVKPPTGTDLNEEGRVCPCNTARALLSAWPMSSTIPEVKPLEYRAKDSQDAKYIDKTLRGCKQNILDKLKPHIINTK
jgi:hypothetical protein